MRINKKEVNILKVSAGAIVAVAAFGILLFGAEIFVFTPNVGEKTVKIERGMDVFDIAGLLKDEGVIDNRFGFVTYVTLTGNLNNLQAGEYSFEGEYAIFQVADIVSSGLSLSSQRTVFIPEGSTLRQIDTALLQSGVDPVGKVANLKKSDLERDFPFLRQIPGGIESLEGFLFPDTYKFQKKSPANIIVRKMLENFEEKTAEVRNQVEKSGRNFYDVLSLASILEKEVPVEDMPRAAGVLKNRLDADMLLQTDATLVYALGRPLARSDIDTLDSFYNSYQHLGLPPTPISNPGIVALEAAFNPEDNDFFFYLSRRDNGDTIFSRTFQEHDTARAMYLR